MIDMEFFKKSEFCQMVKKGKININTSGNGYSLVDLIHKKYYRDIRRILVEKANSENICKVIGKYKYLSVLTFYDFKQACIFVAQEEVKKTIKHFRKENIAI